MKTDSFNVELRKEQVQSELDAAMIPFPISLLVSLYRHYKKTCGD